MPTYTKLVVLVAALVAAFFAAPSAASAAPELAVEPVVSGLTIPTDMAFTPDGAMVYSERGATAAGAGTTRISVVLLGENGTVDADDERRQLVADLSDVIPTNGVMSIVASPDFAENRELFTCQSYREGTVSGTRIVRWTVDEGYTTLTRVANIVTGTPWGSNPRAGEHIGCRVRFDAQGRLHAATGDGFNGLAPQDPRSLNGKVLRVDPNTGAGVRGNMGPAWRGIAPAPEFAPTDVETATIEYNGQLHVFGPTITGRGIRHAWYDPGARRWLSESLDTVDAGGNGESVVAIVFQGDLHLFSDTRTGNGVRHVWYSRADRKWLAETLDAVGSAGTGLSTSIYTANGQLQVFGQRVSGGGWRHLWFDGRWNAENLDEAGTPGTSSDTMVYTANGQLQVFGPANGGGVRHGWYDPSAGWLFETLGATVTSGENPVAFMYGSQLQVMADGNDPGQTGQVFYDGRRWVSATLAAGRDPSQIQWAGDGALHLFGTTATGVGVRHGWYNPAAGQWFYETLDAPQATGTGTSTSAYGGQLHVFGGATNGGMRQTFFTPSPFDSRILTFGHRNPQGLALQPGTGRMYSGEHGPGWDDEINLLVPGANFGWDPSFNRTEAYTDAVPMTDLVKFPSARLPVWASGIPTTAVSGITFIQGAQWGAWDGALVGANLKTQKLIVMQLTDDGLGIEWQTQTLGGIARLRTPVQGPDGNLYVATSRGGTADEILKVVPDGVVPTNASPQ